MEHDVGKWVDVRDQIPKPGEYTVKVLDCQLWRAYWTGYDWLAVMQKRGDFKSRRILNHVSHWFRSCKYIHEERKRFTDG